MNAPNGRSRDRCRINRFLGRSCYGHGSFEISEAIEQLSLDKARGAIRSLLSMTPQKLRYKKTVNGRRLKPMMSASATPFV